MCMDVNTSPSLHHKNFRNRDPAVRSVVRLNHGHMLSLLLTVIFSCSEVLYELELAGFDIPAVLIRFTAIEERPFDPPISPAIA